MRRQTSFRHLHPERLAWAVDLDFGYTLPLHLDFTPHEMELAGDGGFEYVA